MNRSPARLFRRLAPLAILAGLLLSYGPARAQSPAEEPVRAMVAMPDGPRLATDVHLPGGRGPFPVLFVRTPYGSENKSLIARFFAEQGIAAVVQNARGTGGSEGGFVPLVHEYADGVATLDWIARQPWSDGRVVAYGASYGGHAALLLATSGHPSLRAVAHLAGWGDNRTFLYDDGVLRLMAHVPWLATYGAGAAPPDDWGPVLSTTPLSTFFAAFEPVEDAIFRSFPYERVDVPVLHLTGWYDYVYPGTMETYREIAARGDGAVDQRLVVGPWRHNQIWMDDTRVGDEDFGPRAKMGFDAVHAVLASWFERHLANEPAPPREAPVRVFVMGENRWREAEVWPPEDVELTRWYLASGGDATDPDGSGRLTSAPPDGAGSDAFVYDPNDPVPTVGGVLSHFFRAEMGPRDQRSVEARSDVLVYSSDPLEEEIVLAGPIRAILHVASEAPDFDVAAKLVVVRPDGSARIVEDGITRAAHAAVSIVPGEVRPYAVEIGHTALRIPVGHRLRLEVSAGNFPKYARNPQTGEDPLEAESFRSARHVVHHSEGHPSHLVLPIWRDLPDLTGAR